MQIFKELPDDGRNEVKAACLAIKYHKICYCLNESLQHEELWLFGRFEFPKMCERVEKVCTAVNLFYGYKAMRVIAEADEPISVTYDRMIKEMYRQFDDIYILMPDQLNWCLS